MPFCHVGHTFKGSPDLQGVITFITVLGMIALGSVAQSFAVMGLVGLLGG